MRHINFSLLPTGTAARQRPQRTPNQCRVGDCEATATEREEGNHCKGRERGEEGDGIKWRCIGGTERVLVERVVDRGRSIESLDFSTTGGWLHP